MLVMATGDVASRPKGGWAEYRNGEHAKTGLHGKKSGELMGAQKAYGTGAYTDAPFRFRSIEEFVKSIRWFYDGLLEKMEGGPLNPASTSRLKQLMKALSYLMGVRRVYVPKALTREIVEAACGMVHVHAVEEMTSASMLVADFVLGGRAIDMYLADWSEISFEWGQQDVAGGAAEEAVAAAAPAVNLRVWAFLDHQPLSWTPVWALEAVRTCSRSEPRESDSWTVRRRLFLDPPSHRFP